LNRTGQSKYQADKNARNTMFIGLVREEIKEQNKNSIGLGLAYSKLAIRQEKRVI